MHAFRGKILLLSLTIVIFHTAHIHAWECEITLNGPNTIKVGQTITLSASGTPEGGSYSWFNTPNLVPHGSSAELTGFVPSFSDYIQVGVTYTTPRGKRCTDRKWIWVCGTCSVSISGPNEVSLGETIGLSATGDPPGGTYAWSPVPGLVPSGASAQFTGQAPGYVTIEVTYTTPGMETCPDTHVATAFGVGSITGPICVNSGSALTKGHFTIMTDPIGFEPLVTVSPLTFSTLFQSEEATVIASCGPGTADDATTSIIVVNSNVKNGKSISFEIPNFLNDVLKKIGLGDKTDLSVKESFKDFKECCEFGVFTSTDGTFSGNLSVDAGPFTIIGIPIPPKFKKWVAADLVNATLSGGGSVGIDGSYNACDNDTDWSGEGDLTTGVEVGGMVKAKVPEVIVLEGAIKGSTSITEKLSIDLVDLKLTTNWGGLTGKVGGKIKIFRKKMTFKASRTYFEKGGLLPVTIPLPSLNKE
jgi:hypothetical protein